MLKGKILQQIKMERLTTIFQHLNAAERAVGLREVATLPTYQRKADDIVVVSALRTPITRAKRGSFKVSLVSQHLILA